jgi:hypothetical protein
MHHFPKMLMNTKCISKTVLSTKTHDRTTLMNYISGTMNLQDVLLKDLHHRNWKFSHFVMLSRGQKIITLANCTNWRKQLVTCLPHKVICFASHARQQGYLRSSVEKKGRNRRWTKWPLALGSSQPLGNRRISERIREGSSSKSCSIPACTRPRGSSRSATIICDKAADGGGGKLQIGP